VAEAFEGDSADEKFFVEVEPGEGSGRMRRRRSLLGLRQMRRVVGGQRGRGRRGTTKVSIEKSQSGTHWETQPTTGVGIPPREQVGEAYDIQALVGINKRFDHGGVDGSRSRTICVGDFIGARPGAPLSGCQPG
jgi:hypothetical protein